MKSKVDSGMPKLSASQNHCPGLLSAVLAYFVSYVLLASFRLGSVVNFEESMRRREVRLFWVLMFVWATLVTGLKATPVAQAKHGFSINRHIVAEVIFAGILACFYLVGSAPRQVVTFFLIGSLLYIPIRWTFLRIGLHLGRAGRLIQHDSRILLIGSKERAKDAIAAIRGSGEEYEVVGCLDPDPSQVGRRVAELTVLGTTEDLSDYLFGHNVDLIMFALPLQLVPNVAEAIGKAMEAGIPVSVAMECGIPRTNPRLSNHSLSYHAFATVPTMILSNVPDDSAYLASKRLLDIVFSGILLILLSPLFLIIAVLIKVTSPGPLLYPWKVLGRNRRPFVGYKFRTMVPNADELKPRLLQHNEMQGPVFKMRGDPRITPLGKLLRKYSIDELPQLYSVLKGDMSLVGPRPPAKQEADRFEFWQRRKLSVKPGITCLWQVNGRSEISSFDEWARLDIEYIERASMSCDLRILLRTIPAVIRGKGAH
jgi:exopolysaccharide biosynthesis polyprenyl glycosylphosphotransferase